MFTRRRVIAGLSVLAVATVTASSVQAQAWPNRPMTIIVPWGAGGGTDAHMRTLATFLEKDLGVAINVINQTGGNGVTGHSAIANAAADGYTFGAVTAEITMMHQTGLTKLTHRDFTPISLINRTEAGFQVAKDSPWNNLKDAIEDIKKNPGKFKASGTGQGGIWHIALGGLLKSAGVGVNAAPWIPSQGAARAAQELLAGGIHIVTASTGESAALVEAGQLKPLAVMGPVRNPKFPTVPTVREQGYPWELTSFISLQGPKGIDPAVVARIDASVKRILSTTDWMTFANGRGFSINYGGPKDLEALQIQLDKDMASTMGSLGLIKS
ncbi:MAG: Bug family tripartite tricarboxylate transporter substrate binding protein [Beijerinckiaceae bacterium]